MTGHQKIAMRNIKNAFNYEVGGVYNSYLDGEEIDITLEEMKEDIYTCAVNDKYVGCGVINGAAPTAMRFAGKEFMVKYIDWLFENDDDVKEIPWKERTN